MLNHVIAWSLRNISSGRTGHVAPSAGFCFGQNRRQFPCHARKPSPYIKRKERGCKPRPAQGDGYYEVLEGLEAGDKVVTRANFLIDAESNLKSALDSFGNNGSDAGQSIPEATPQHQHGDH